MKKHILTVAASALLAIPSITIAEDKPAGDKPAGERPERGGGPGGRGGFSPEERMKRMTEALGLTEDQQAKIKAIYEKGAEEMKALREKGRDNLTDEERAKMREFFQKQQEEVAAVLTPEQKEKMKNLRPRRGEGGRPGGPGGEGRRPRPDGEKPGDAK